MGLIKFIILLVLVYVALTFWRQFKARQSNKAKSSAAPDSPTLMVRCSRCKVYLPENQALHEGDRWYCSKNHLEADHNG